MGGRFGVITRHHHHLDAQRLELPNGSGRRVAHGIGHAQQPHGLAGHGDVEHRFGLGQQLLGLREEGRGEAHAFISQQAAVANQHGLAVHVGGGPFAFHGPKAGGGQARPALGIGVAYHGLRQRVLTLALHGGHHLQQLARLLAGQRPEIRHGGLTAGDGAGFIQ